MARFDAFDRELQLATADMEPEAINKALAAFARAELAKVITAGAPATYEKFVNGIEGAQEETVKAPGPILYLFSNWTLVINTALDELRQRSPKRSGRYASSFLVLVGGRTVITDFSRIRADAEVIIFNPQPYTRRIETGSMRFSVPASHFDATRSVLSRRFGTAFRVESKFVEVPGGIHPLAPYRLKQSGGHMKANGARGRRRGRDVGDVLTYPALIINPA